MPHVYTGTLTDIGLGALVGKSPQMRVRPEREAFGQEGLVSAAPVPVTLGTGGAFSMSLLASSEMNPPTKYVIEVGRFEDAFDGPRFHGVDIWSFFARAGGGNVANMIAPPPGAGRIWIGISEAGDGSDIPAGYDAWIDTATNPPTFKELV